MLSNSLPAWYSSVLMVNFCAKKISSNVGSHGCCGSNAPVRDSFLKDWGLIYSLEAHLFILTCPVVVFMWSVLPNVKYTQQ